jgi:hypothetical protein
MKLNGGGGRICIIIIMTSCRLNSMTHHDAATSTLLLYRTLCILENTIIELTMIPLLNLNSYTIKIKTGEPVNSVKVNQLPYLFFVILKPAVGIPFID